MQITDVKKEDVIKATQLVKALNVAKFGDLTAQDMIALHQTLAWAGELAKLLGKSFQESLAKPEISIEPAIPLKPTSAKKQSAKLTLPKKGK